jgi:uncharacterized protein (UPF0216 family)
MDILNKDGYGQESYFDKDKLETLKNISEHSETINKKGLDNHRELLDSNICQYIRLIVQMHLDQHLTACVVMIDKMNAKKRDVIVSQLQHLRLNITTRVLINFDDGILDLLYQPKAPEDS